MTMMARSRWWRGDSIENQTFGVRFGRAIGRRRQRSETRTPWCPQIARGARQFFPNVDSGEDTLSSRARGGLSPACRHRDTARIPPHTSEHRGVMSCASSARATPSHVRRRRARGGHRPRRPAATSRRAWSALAPRQTRPRLPLAAARGARVQHGDARAFVPSTTYEGDDGVPFFALSDADRASELRADADAVAEAAARPDAVLLPLTGADVWVIPTDVEEEDGARASSRRSRRADGSPRRRCCVTCPPKPSRATA